MVIIAVTKDGKRRVYYGTENVSKDAIIKIPIEPAAK